MTAHELIDLLNDAQIWFTLKTVRDNAVMFECVVPGQRWEAEVFPDGHVDLEVFKSSGPIGDKNELVELITEFAEPKP